MKVLKKKKSASENNSQQERFIGVNADFSKGYDQDFYDNFYQSNDKDLKSVVAEAVNNKIYSQKWNYFITDKYESIDINDKNDFDICKSLYR